MNRSALLRTLLIFALAAWPHPGVAQDAGWTTRSTYSFMNEDTLFGMQPKVTVTPDNSGGYLLRVELPYGVNKIVGEARGTIGNAINVDVPMTFEMGPGWGADDDDFFTNMTRPSVRIQAEWVGTPGRYYFLQGGGTFNVETPQCTFEHIGTCERKNVAFMFEAEQPQTVVAAPPSHPCGSIRIQSVTGDVEVIRARRDASGNLVWGEGEVLEAGAEICSGDRIVTGMDSSARIIDSQGERVVKVHELTDMKPAEEFSEEDKVRTRLWLKAGEVEVIDMGPIGSDFSIKTGVAVAGPKGTRFVVRHVESPEPQTFVEVSEGVVEVTPVNPNLYIMIVEAGENVAVRQGGQMFGTNIELIEQPGKLTETTTPSQPPAVKFTANPPQTPAQTAAPSQLPVVKLTAPRPSPPAAPPQETVASPSPAPNTPAMDAVPVPSQDLVNYLVLCGESVCAELRRGETRWQWAEAGTTFSFEELDRTETRLVIHDPSRDMYHYIHLDTGESFWRVGMEGSWNPHYRIATN